MVGDLPFAPCTTSFSGLLVGHVEFELEGDAGRLPDFKGLGDDAVQILLWCRP